MERENKDLLLLFLILAALAFSAKRITKTVKAGASLGDRAIAQVIKRLHLRDGSRFGGVFTVECWRWHDADGRRFRDSRGRFERRLIWSEAVSNIVTNEELDHILNVEFHAATQITAWYCLLVESDTNPAAGMTYATPVFTECTAYDEATRPAFTEAAASSQSITNSANKAEFTISGTKTLYGAALVGGGTDADTKGDAAGGGTLACYAKFASSKNVEDDDVVQLTYTLSAADDGV